MKIPETQRNRRGFPATGLRPPKAPDHLRAPVLSSAKAALREEAPRPVSRRGPALPLRWIWLAAMLALAVATFGPIGHPAPPLSPPGISPFPHIPRQEALMRLRADGRLDSSDFPSHFPFQQGDLG